MFAALNEHSRRVQTRREPPLLGSVNVAAVWIEGRESADDADHDGHWVGVALEAAEEGNQLLVHHAMPLQLELKRGELGRRRQLRVYQ